MNKILVGALVLLVVVIISEALFLLLLGKRVTQHTAVNTTPIPRTAFTLPDQTHAPVRADYYDVAADKSQARIVGKLVAIRNVGNSIIADLQITTSGGQSFTQPLVIFIRSKETDFALIVQRTTNVAPLRSDSALKPILPSSVAGVVAKYMDQWVGVTLYLKRPATAPNLPLSIRTKASAS